MIQVKIKQMLRDYDLCPDHDQEHEQDQEINKSNIVNGIQRES